MLMTTWDFCQRHRYTVLTQQLKEKQCYCLSVDVAVRGFTILTLVPDIIDRMYYNRRDLYPGLCRS